MRRVIQALQLSPNQIIETIVSTQNVDGSLNAAPMGVIFTEKGKAILKPFIETNTYKNIFRERCCVINLVSDPEIFLRTTFKELKKKIPERWFKTAVKVKAPMLKTANAIIEVKAKRIMQKEQRAEVECEILRIDIFKTPPFGYCRANFALIESIIHATRIIEALREGKNREAEKLHNLVKLYRELIERVAPKSNYTKLMIELTEKIDIAK